MAKQIGLALIFLVLATLGLAQAGDDEGRDEPRGHAPSRVTKAHDFGGDHYAAGSSVRVREPVAGDLFATGGSIDVGAPVSGDVVMMGASLRLSAAAGQDLYAAGGRLAIDAPVGHNLRVAGGQVELLPKGIVSGNVSVAGGDVILRSEIKGSLQVGGGRVLIDGPVGGDVVCTAGSIELGPNARLAGGLRYRSDDGLRRDAAAQVAGTVERLPMPQSRSSGPIERGHGMRILIVGSVLWTLGLIVLCAVFVAALPTLSRRVCETWRARMGMSLLLGFIVLACTPVAIVLLLISVVGVPLALLALPVYAALLLVGYASCGLALGTWALARFKVEAIDRPGWQIASAGLALFLLALLAAIPYLGGIVAFLATLSGIGALALQFERCRSQGARHS